MSTHVKSSVYIVMMLSLYTIFCFLQNEKDQTHIFCTLADELNVRIRAVLAERAKDRTNEWRRFVREVEVISLKAPRKMHLEMSSAEFVCCK